MNSLRLWALRILRGIAIGNKFLQLGGELSAVILVEKLGQMYIPLGYKNVHLIAHVFLSLCGLIGFWLRYWLDDLCFRVIPKLVSYYVICTVNPKQRLGHREINRRNFGNTVAGLSEFGWRN